MTHTYKKSETENIKKKIELYLRFNNTTIAGLAKTVENVPYQTIYRVINTADYSLSTNSIKTIAEFFNSPIDKFVSPYWTLNLDCYSSLNSFLEQSSYKLNVDLRLDYLDIYNTLDFFALNTQLDQLGPITYSCNGVKVLLNSNYIMLFHKTDKINNEGNYLCKISHSDTDKRLLVADVISINSLTVIIKDTKSDKYITIEKEKIDVFGKYIFSMPITEEYQPAIAYRPQSLPIAVSPGEIQLD